MEIISGPCAGSYPIYVQLPKPRERGARAICIPPGPLEKQVPTEETVLLDREVFTADPRSVVGNLCEPLEQVVEALIRKHDRLFPEKTIPANSVVQLGGF